MIEHRTRIALALAAAMLAVLPPRLAVAETGVAAPIEIGVDGNTLTLDGAPWLPRGVQISGFEATEEFFCGKDSAYPRECVARHAYGLPELDAAHRFGADTLRFQVSQPFLDPQSPLYTPSYVRNTFDAIRFARRQGFAVVIMVQDEPISGQPQQTEVPLPTAETERDLDLLAGAFGQDRGVMLELFNEPTLAATPANWALWKHGGIVDWAPAGYPTQQVTAIGMQVLIDRLRGEGALNVLVLDGLAFAHTLAGLPPIADPLGRIVYAVHPYFDGCDVESLWDGEFGDASASIPVFADEWSAEADAKLGLGIAGQKTACTPPPPLPNYQESVDFLNYIRLHHIALAGGAFDVPGFMVKDVPGWTPSNYNHYAPDAPVAEIKNDDAGLLVRKLFATQYRVPITYADGVTH
jgi:hypothetical protein